MCSEQSVCSFIKGIRSPRPTLLNHGIHICITIKATIAYILVFHTAIHNERRGGYAWLCSRSPD